MQPNISTESIFKADVQGHLQNLKKKKNTVDFMLAISLKG